MTTYADNAAGLLVQGQTFRYNFGPDQTAYLSAASNLIAGQATGQVLQIVVYSKKVPTQQISLAYGTVLRIKIRGYLVVATLAGSPNASVRIVLSDEPYELQVQTVAASLSGTASVSIDGQTVGVAPSTSLAGAAIDPRNIRALTSSDQPDVSVNQADNLKTDIGAAGTYAKDATLTGGSVLVKTSPLGTKQNSGTLPPTALPESTAESVKVAGVGNVNAGTRLYFTLAVAPWVSVAAATEVIAYVCLKGHTSGTYYAIAYAGEVVAGYIDFNYTPEAIDIVWRNSSAATGSNAFANWESTTP